MAEEMNLNATNVRAGSVGSNLRGTAERRGVAHMGLSERSYSSLRGKWKLLVPGSEEAIEVTVRCAILLSLNARTRNLCRIEGSKRSACICLFVCWLLNVPATCELRREGGGGRGTTTQLTKTDGNSIPFSFPPLPLAFTDTQLHTHTNSLAYIDAHSDTNAHKLTYSLSLSLSLSLA